MSMTIVIATTGFPDLLDMQIRAVRRFVSPEARVVVVDDSRSWPHSSNGQRFSVSWAVKRVCRAQDATYLRMPFLKHLRRRTLFPQTAFPRDLHSPSARNAASVQYGLLEAQRLGFGELLVLDSDMLPFRQFRKVSDLDPWKVRYVAQERASAHRVFSYAWIGFFYAVMEACDQTQPLWWDIDSVDGVRLDTGGASRHWLALNSGKAIAVRVLSSGHWQASEAPCEIPPALMSFLDHDRDPATGMQYCEIVDDSFLHLRGGSNWMGQPLEEQARRRERLLSAFEEILH